MGEKNLRQSGDNGRFEPTISLLDILHFLKKGWKTILLMVILLEILTVVYLSLIPTQHEASATVAMIKLPSSSIYPPGADIEDPNTFVARMNFAMDEQRYQMEQCDNAWADNSFLGITKKLKWSTHKTLPGTAILQLRASSPQKAANCLKTIVDTALLGQKQLIIPYLQESKDLLAARKFELDLYGRIGNSDLGSILLYLHNNNFLKSQEELRLQRMVNFMEEPAPIFTGNIKISKDLSALQNNIAYIIAGFFGGFLIGIFIEIVRNLQKKLPTLTS